MKRTVEISAGFSGKLSTGQFENESPSFFLKEIVELDYYMSDEEIITRQKQLQKYCYDQFKQQAEVAYQEKIAKQYTNIRWYDVGDKRYPSVTSIIDLDKNFGISPEQLAQYGARGTVIHKQIERFLKTGIWTEAKDLTEVSFEYMTVIKGDLGLLFDDVNFRAFYEEYPFEVTALEQNVIHFDLKYGGRYDAKVIIPQKGKWGKIEGVLFDVPTLVDFKTTANLDKMRGFTQLGAYSLCDPEVKQFLLVHLNNEVQSGYSKPIITNNLERYQQIFKTQRKNFEKRYGI